MQPAATTQKRCPGFSGIDQPAHMLPGSPEFFSANRSAPDGLATRCRRCDSAYMRAWSARQRAIKRADAIDPSLEGGIARDRALDQARAISVEGYARLLAEREPGAKAPAREPVVHELAATVRGAGTSVIAAGPAAVETQTAEVASSATEALPDLAHRPGWATRTIAGRTYAIPQDAAEVGTAEGQAALELAANALRVQRAAQKRDQRARAAAEA